MPVEPTPIPPIPEPVPSTDDPENFDERADDTLGALPGTVAGMNQAAADTYQNSVEAEASAVAAADSAADAAASALTAVNAPGTSATVAGNLNMPNNGDTIAFNLDQVGKAFALGQFVRVAWVDNVTVYFEGFISAFDSGTGAISVLVTGHNGAGGHIGWSVALAFQGAITIAQITDYEDDQAAREAVLNASIDAVDARVDNVDKGIEPTENIAIVAGAITINLALVKRDWKVTLSANITNVNFQNAPAAGTLRGFTLRIVFDGNVRSISWPAAVKWAGGTAPTFTYANGKIALLQFYTDDAGVKIHGFFIGESG